MIAAAVPWKLAPLVSSAALRHADEEALLRYGIEALQLMELAGFQVARVVERWMEGAQGKRIAVVAGSGNNGGDALVAARWLRQRGALIEVWIVPPRDARGLAARQARTIRQLQIPVREATGALRFVADLVIDGLLGTGIRLPLRAPLPALIDAINASGRPVAAVATVTLVAAKRGLDVAAAGRVFLADIGMPPAVLGTDGDAIAALYARGDLLELSKSTPS